MLKLGFVNVGRVNPYIASRIDVVVGRYCRHLNFIGKHVLGIVAASVMLSPSPVFVGFILSMLMAWIIYKGREYREHLSEILGAYAGWKILHLLAKSWLFWVSVAVVDALLVGLLSLDQVAGLKAFCVSLLLGAF